MIVALFGVLEGAERFNFASSDPGAAAEQVLTHLEAGPAWLVGYSFGGGVASLVDDPRVQGWCLIAPALGIGESVIGADSRPKHVLAAERDTFFPPESLLQATSDWTATTHDVVPGLTISCAATRETWPRGAPPGWPRASRCRRTRPDRR